MAKFTVTAHGDTVMWIARVIESCETEEQRKSAGRLAKNWLKQIEPRILKSTIKEWNAFLDLGNHLANAMKAKMKELKKKK